MIYLDHNATAPLHPAALDAMLPHLRGGPANASALCRPGREAKRAIALAREQAAALLGCEPEELVFTSGGTESNHAGIHSALAIHPGRRRITATAAEHSAVRNLLLWLEKKGYAIDWVGVGRSGAPDPDAFAAAIGPETALATAMLANNETGALFPAEALAAAARERGVPFHCDAVQAAGKHPLALGETAIGSAAFAAHKLGGPQGVGALYVSRRMKFTPWLLGGGQENGRRAGTENVAGIAGFGAACAAALADLPGAIARMGELRDALERLLFDGLDGLARNGDPARRLPNTANLRFPGMSAEEMLILLDREGVCCSAGSACTAGSTAPSHVLKAMGLSDAEAKSSLRFSLGPATARGEIEEAAARILRAARKIRDTP